MGERQQGVTGSVPVLLRRRLRAAVHTVHPYSPRSPRIACASLSPVRQLPMAGGAEPTSQIPRGGTSVLRHSPSSYRLRSSLAPTARAAVGAFRSLVSRREPNTSRLRWQGKPRLGRSRSTLSMSLVSIAAVRSARSWATMTSSSGASSSIPRNRAPRCVPWSRQE